MTDTVESIAQMKRAMIFDFGGVLMRTRDYAPRLAWDERLGLPYGSVERAVHGCEEWRLAQLGQMPVEQYWQAVGQALILRDEALAQLQVDFYSGDVLDLHLIGLIKRLREEGVTVGLLSNDAPPLRAKLKRLGIDTLFNPLLISAEMGLMKPDTAIYHLLIERLKRPANEVVFLDDNAANVAAANAAGIQGVQFVRGMDVEAALRPLITAG
jgi:putative hydrolase of the HAD superfamily